MTEKQLIAKYEKERVELAARHAVLGVRLTALDDLLASLRVMTGEAPPRKKGNGKATGTKALILDVLADGAWRSAGAIAEAIKVKTPAAGWHLKELVASGDVSRRGKSRATSYGIQ